MLLLGVRSEIEWIQETARIPVLGGIFLFLFTFIPAVVLSFLAQSAIPVLYDDLGFTKAMLVLLPGWSLLLWFRGVKLYCFFLPSWVLFGTIAVIKAILLIAGIDNGQ